ncbi:MAG: TonB-dependent receptor plug domain-containing protein [Tannerellaceae bacterium]|nr:TonB-dependent receptor plug domain-containing protein [Tannerellaceae bacterium]
MFAGQPISYELAGNQVVLRKVTSGDTQQTAPVRKVTGTVLDEYGMELIGVNVTVKGNHAIGSVTDIDGNFELSVPSDGTLVFSYIGYSPQEVKASAAPLRITMREDFNQIDEVVVVGYGTMQKRAITSSITLVKGSDLAQGVGGASIATALQGKVSGLTISGSSSPNSSNEFQLRGVASINSSKGPLVMIDGIPGGDLRSLNQEDIESIDVLKDASAGAIYGTRAAGGVILVTTKQGHEGPVRLTYTGELTTESVRRRPQVLSAREYIEYGVGGTNYGHDTDWYDELLNKNPLS